MQGCARRVARAGLRVQGLRAQGCMCRVGDNREFEV